MNKIIAVVCLCFCSLGCGNNFEKTISDIDKNTISVVNSDGTGGTGLIIKAKGNTYVLTNYHVVENVVEKHAVIKLYKKIFKNCKKIASHETSATVEYFDKDLDIAILKAEINLHDVKSTKFDTRQAFVKNGCEVFYYGDFASWNHDFGNVGLSTGKLCYSRPGYDVFIMTVVQGNSGGGIYTYDGKCIGVATATYHHVGARSVPIRVIYNWAKEKKIQWLFSS